MQSVKQEKEQELNPSFSIASFDASHSKKPTFSCSNDVFVYHKRQVESPDQPIEERDSIVPQSPSSCSGQGFFAWGYPKSNDDFLATFESLVLLGVQENTKIVSSATELPSVSHGSIPNDSELY